MKKLILLLSVLSIFLIPSMSFAVSSLPSYTGNYYIIFESKNINDTYVLYSSDLPIKIKNKNYQNYEIWLYKNGSWSLYVPFQSSTNYLLPTDFKNNTLYSSNHDVYDASEPSEVFFSLPALVQVAEELPPMLVQTGGTVLSVALMGFGVLLVVSLIPRLVKRFLF